MPTHLLQNPGLTAVITVKFDDVTVRFLVEESDALPVIPLPYAKLVTRLGLFYNRGSTLPGSGVLEVDNTTIKIAPVDLNLRVIQNERSDVRVSCRFARVELALKNSDDSQAGGITAGLMIMNRPGNHFSPSWQYSLRDRSSAW